MPCAKVKEMRRGKGKSMRHDMMAYGDSGAPPKPKQPAPKKSGKKSAKKHADRDRY